VVGHARDPTEKQDDHQSTTRTQVIVTAHLDALRSAGDCGTVLTEDVALTIMETGEITQGRRTVVALLNYLHQQAFAAPPSVSTLVAGVNRAMIEAEFAGIHIGEFAGIAPTGHEVRVRYVAAYDLHAGAITAVRLYLPLDTLVRQLRDP
jgi:predicted ester cyclase